MRRGGMTLLELMSVVAITGAMASMSLYGMDRLTKKQRQMAAIRDLSALVLEARAQARSHNQAVRLEVTAVASGMSVRWTRLACGDAWGRNCPSAACVSSPTCSSGCVCDQTSSVVQVPPGVSSNGLAGLCFLPSSGAPRGATCAQGGAAVTSVRFDLPDEPTPYLLVIEPLSGSSRLVDCGRVPKDSSCP